MKEAIHHNILITNGNRHGKRYVSTEKEKSENMLTDGSVSKARMDLEIITADLSRLAS